MTGRCFEVLGNVAGVRRLAVRIDVDQERVASHIADKGLLLLREDALCMAFFGFTGATGIGVVTFLRLPHLAVG